MAHIAYEAACVLTELKEANKRKLDCMSNETNGNECSNANKKKREYFCRNKEWESFFATRTKLPKIETRFEELPTYLVSRFDFNSIKTDLNDPLTKQPLYLGVTPQARAGSNAFQVQRNFDKITTSLGNVTDTRVGAFMVLAATVDSRLRCRHNMSAWIKWMADAKTREARAIAWANEIKLDLKKPFTLIKKKGRPRNSTGMYARRMMHCLIGF